MGVNSTKKEILQIIEKSITNQRKNNKKDNNKIEYKFNYKSDLDEENNPSSDEKEKENV